MTAIGPANSWSTVIVDPAARGLADPQRSVVGKPRPLSRDRVIWALPLNGVGAPAKRYYPDHPPTEQCYFGLDFSMVIPYGEGITAGALAIFTNAATPVPADADWTVVSPPEVRGRSVYALLTGGVEGTDYQLRWTATDTAGSVWPRMTLVLVAETS